MTIGMGRNSWILAVRGVLAILFGLYALLAPWRALAGHRGGGRAPGLSPCRLSSSRL